MASPIRESNRIVLLVGAGFSTEWGPPVMNSFMDRARQNYFRLQSGPSGIITTGEPSLWVSKDLTGDLLSAYEAMFAFLVHCERSGRQFERNWENIEELYTQADLLRLSESPSKTKSKQLCDQIAWAIWHVYRTGCQPTKIVGEVVKSIARANLRPSIVTTNYDLFIELSLRGSNFFPYYPGFGRERENGCYAFLEEAKETSQYQSSQIPLIKLHGSVNWFWKDPDARLVVALLPFGGGAVFDILCDQFNIERLNRERFNAGSWSKSKKRKLVPLIVPPMLGKASFASIIGRQWKEAVTVIREARQVWVIGYSFPSTDAFMLRLLSEGLQDNRHLERFVIVNRQEPGEWEPRLSSMFTSSFRTSKVNYVQATAAGFLRSVHKLTPDVWHSEISKNNLQFRLSSRHDLPVEYL